MPTHAATPAPGPLSKKLHRALDEQSPLLQVKDLAVSFDNRNGPRIQAVDGVRMTIYPRQTLAVVGESGCGKSVTAMSALHLIPRPPGRWDRGQMMFATDDGPRDLLTYNEQEIRNVRGNEIAMIFQEPMTSLNPVYTIGDQILEAILLHQRVDADQARQIAIAAMTDVGITQAADRLAAYPHQFSGGMRQRVMIAMALACSPQLLVADEPTTALDVTIQAQILELMRDLKTRVGAAIMLITHDLGVVAEMCQRVVVMYAGRKVEEGTVEEIFLNPLHPYTQGLMGSMPKLGSSLHETGRSKLTEIQGQVPSLRKPIIGCAFAGRCPNVTDVCRQMAPAIEEKAPKHLVACHYAPRAAAAA